MLAKMNKPEQRIEQLAELADEIIFFCEKTTVLAEKVFHPAASGAQLTASYRMLSLFHQTD